MLHVWLIPVLALVCLFLAGFYLLMKYRGGTGIRTEGQTLVDKPAEEDNLPPG
jgi:hypothetical protein